MRRAASFLLLAVAAAIDAEAPDPQAVGVRCSTTKGNITLVVNPSWAPLGAARFLKMVDSGFFDRIAAYRVVPGFLVQFGIPYTPAGPQAWPKIRDDPNVGVQCPDFRRGMLAFAGSGPDSRTTQVFIAFEDDPNLGTNAWDNPFGMVTTGMDVVDRLYSGYGDLSAFGGRAPDPTRMSNQGAAFLRTEYPLMDYFTSCSRLAQAPAVPKRGGMARPCGSAAPAQLPRCSADFCGSGIGFTGAAVCLCHENCLYGEPGELPCCQGFAEACPAQYARGPQAAPAAPAGKAAVSAAASFSASSQSFSALPPAVSPTAPKRGKRIAKKASPTFSATTTTTTAPVFTQSAPPVFTQSAPPVFTQSSPPLFTQSAPPAFTTTSQTVIG